MTAMLRLRVIVSAAALGLAQSVLAQQPAPRGSDVREFLVVDDPGVALTGAIHGTGSAPSHRQPVILENGRIRAGGPTIRSLVGIN